MINKIFLYANHPLIKFDNKYYAKTKAFIDFLSNLAMNSDHRFLVVPCLTSDQLESIEGLVEIDLSMCQVIELPSYSERWMAPLVSFFSALKLHKRVKLETNKSDSSVLIGGPGPNSFLFWSSLFSPSSVQFAFFIRGDTLKTVKKIYKGRIVYPLAVGLVMLFRSRIRCLLKKKKANVFTYGKALFDQYPAPHEKQHVIHPLIENDWIRPYNSRAISVDNLYLKILFVGRLSPEKNIINLVEACYIMQKNGLLFNLTIIGEGPLSLDLCELINSYDLTDRVLVKGHISDSKTLMKEYDEHDLLCLPSTTEGTPRVIVEAFTRGCAVLATDVGSIKDMFPDNIKILKSAEPKSIFDGLLWCYNNRAELEKMTARGHKATDKFLIDKNSDTVLSILYRKH